MEVQGKRILLKKFATIDDTLEHIPRIIDENYESVKDLALELEGGSISETLENVWNFVRENVQYQNDRRGEELRTPARTIADGIGDCDDMSIMIASLLLNLGIPSELNIVGYIKTMSEDRYSHIYVSARDENGKRICLDTVPEIPYYGYEVKPIVYHKVIKMELAELNGLEGTKAEEIENIDPAELALVEAAADEAQAMHTPIEGLNDIEALDDEDDDQALDAEDQDAEISGLDEEDLEAEEDELEDQALEDELDDEEQIMGTLEIVDPEEDYDYETDMQGLAGLSLKQELAQTIKGMKEQQELGLPMPYDADKEISIAESVLEAWDSENRPEVIDQAIEQSFFRNYYVVIKEGLKNPDAALEGLGSIEGLGNTVYIRNDRAGKTPDAIRARRARRRARKQNEKSYVMVFRPYDLGEVGFLKKFRKRLKRGFKKTVKKIKKGAKKITLKKVWRGVKRYNPLSFTARTAYLGLLRLNFRGHAKKIYDASRSRNSTWRKIDAKWKKLGGTTGDLIKAARAGSSKKRLFGISEDQHIEGLGMAVTTMIGSASTIISSMALLIGAVKGNKPSKPSSKPKTSPSVLNMMKRIGRNTVSPFSTPEPTLQYLKPKPMPTQTPVQKTPQAPVKVGEDVIVPSDNPDGTDEQSKMDKFKSWLGKNKKWLIIGGVVIVAAVVGLIIWKKKAKKQKNKLRGLKAARTRARNKSLKGYVATSRKGKNTTVHYSRKKSSLSGVSRRKRKSRSSGSSSMKALHARAKRIRSKHPRMKYATALKQAAKK